MSKLLLTRRSAGGGEVPPEPPPSGLTILADLDWTTATGTSTAALTDSGAANNGDADASGSGTGGTSAGWGCPETFSVVSGASVGLPAGRGNALSFQMNPGCSHVQFPHIFPLPQNGEDQYWACRAYYRNDTGQTETEQHPHCLWPVGTIEGVPCQIIAQSGGNGNWHPAAAWSSHNSLDSEEIFPFGVYPYTGGGARIWLQRDLWYRYEWIMHWRNATEFRIYVRLYDSDDVTLLADTSTFRHTDIPSLTYASWYAASPDNWFRRRPDSLNANNIRTYSFGNGQSKTNGSFYRVAKAQIALTTSTTAFIGAP